jgi:hypothetical protein
VSKIRVGGYSHFSPTLCFITCSKYKTESLLLSKIPFLIQNWGLLWYTRIFWQGHISNLRAGIYLMQRLSSECVPQMDELIRWATTSSQGPSMVWGPCNSCKVKCINVPEIYQTACN